MSADAFWLGIVGGAAVLWLIALVVRDCVANARRTCERHPTPWYALQKGGPGQRWTPEAWRDASDLSTKISRARRG